MQEFKKSKQAQIQEKLKKQEIEYQQALKDPKKSKREIDEKYKKLVDASLQELEEAKQLIPIPFKARWKRMKEWEESHRE